MLLFILSNEAVKIFAIDKSNDPFLKPAKLLKWHQNLETQNSSNEICYSFKCSNSVPFQQATILFTVPCVTMFPLLSKL